MQLLPPALAQITAADHALTFSSPSKVRQQYSPCGHLSSSVMVCRTRYVSALLALSCASHVSCCPAALALRAWPIAITANRNPLPQRRIATRLCTHPRLASAWDNAQWHAAWGSDHSQAGLQLANIDRQEQRRLACDHAAHGGSAAGPPAASAHDAAQSAGPLAWGAPPTPLFTL